MVHAHDLRKRKRESSPATEEQWRKLPAESGGSAIGSLIHAAVRETTRLKALHAEAGHIFALCTAHLGLQGDALWQRLDDHRSNAVGAAKDVLWWMYSVSSAIEAVNGILCVASRLRLLRPPPQEALQLLGRAVQVSRGRHDAMAREALRRMHHAVVLEFFDAWMVLNR